MDAMSRPDPREVLIAVAAVQDYWVRTGQRSMDDAFADLEPLFWDIVGGCRPPRATDVSRKIYARFSKIMEPGGRIDQIFGGHA